VKLRRSAKLVYTCAVAGIGTSSKSNGEDANNIPLILIYRMLIRMILSATRRPTAVMRPDASYAVWRLQSKAREYIL
jgi:hypothetical protein